MPLNTDQPARQKVIMTKVLRLGLIALSGISISVALLDITGISPIEKWGLGGFLVLNALVLAAAGRILCLLDGQSDERSSVLDLAMVALAVIVVVETFLGTLALLRMDVLTALLGSIAGFVLALPSRRMGYGSLRDPADRIAYRGGYRLVWALVAGLVILTFSQVLWARWLSPPATTDSLRYHLSSAAEWIQHGDLGMPVPSAGDPSTPFFPLNSSLWMVWLMLPFNSDIMVRGVQTPFLILTVLSVARLARMLKLKRTLIWMVASVVATLPDFARQTFVAGNDMILAALLLCATVYIAELWCNANRRWILLSAIALGLAVGTKTTALPYAAILGGVFTIAVIRGYRKRGWKATAMCWAVAAGIVLGLGGYSYVRNLLVMGNPLYPVTISLGNECSLPGLFRITQVWKEFNPYYSFDWRALATDSRQEFGWILPVWVLPGLALSLGRICRDRDLGPLALLLWIPATLLIFWYVLPYHFARFLYATVCWAIILAAWGWQGIFSRQTYWLTFLVVPLLVVNALSIPKFSTAWQSPVYWPAVATILICGAAIMLAVMNHRRFAVVRAIALLLVVCLVALCVAWPSYERKYEDTRFEYWRRQREDGQPAGWAWLDAQSGDGQSRLNIAATGTDTVFPLYGSQLNNRLLYVGVDGSVPRYNWNGPLRLPGNEDYDSWKRALQREQVQYLFVTPHVVTGDWPVEDYWAATDPLGFHLVFSNAGMHIWERQ